jgi:hypothetical protein
MLSSKDNFFESIGALFSAGNLKELSDCFAYPTALYFRDQVRVFASRDMVECQLSSKRDALLRLGMCCTQTRMFGQSLTRGAHWSGWVTWTYLDSCDKIVSTSVARYFCQTLSAGKFQIQMVEYLDKPFLIFAEQDVQQKVHA